MSAGNQCTEMMESVTRYAHQDLTGGEKARVAKHLEGCTSCRDFADFIQGFIETGTQQQPQTLADHPESSLIVALEADELDTATAKRVFAHVVRCNSCRNEYLFLRGVSEAAVKEHIFAAEGPSLKERIKALLSKLLDRTIEMAKHYDPGTVFGPVRILAEAPAFAFRGVAPLSTISQLFEITVGGFVYSIAIGVSSDRRSVWCDVAGTTGQEGSLTVSLYSANGQELLSSNTDASGNGHFNLPRPAGELILIKFQNPRAEEWVPIKLPA